MNLTSWVPILLQNSSANRLKPILKKKGWHPRATLFCCLPQYRPVLGGWIKHEAVVRRWIFLSGELLLCNNAVGWSQGR